MHLPEFETAVRGLLLVVLMNDQLLGAEYHKAVAKDSTPTAVTAGPRRSASSATSAGRVTDRSVVVRRRSSATGSRASF